MLKALHMYLIVTVIINAKKKVKLHVKLEEVALKCLYSFATRKNNKQVITKGIV